MALAVSVGSLRYYFESHLPTYNNRSMQATIFDDVLFRLVTLPPQTYVFIVTDGVVWREDITDMLHYAGRDDLVVRVVDPDLTPSDMFGLMQPIGRYAFFLEPTDTQTVERLNAWYDSRGVGRAYLSPYDSLPIQRQFRLYYVSH